VASSFNHDAAANDLHSSVTSSVNAVESKVVVEVKAMSAIDVAHMATVLAYLKAKDLQVRLIDNFASEVVRIKRIFRSTHGVMENPSRVAPALADRGPHHTGRADFPHPAFANVLGRGMRRESSVSHSGLSP
jgi:hypothetical protein